MARNVYLFVPNLIGYGRVVTLFISLYYMEDSPAISMLWYFTSAFLDAFDGMAARHLDQCKHLTCMALIFCCCELVAHRHSLP